MIQFTNWRQYSQRASCTHASCSYRVLAVVLRQSQGENVDVQSSVGKETEGVEMNHKSSVILKERWREREMEGGESGRDGGETGWRKRVWGGGEESFGGVDEVRKEEGERWHLLSKYDKYQCEKWIMKTLKL